MKESIQITKGTILPESSTSSAILLEGEETNVAVIVHSDPSSIPMIVQIKDPKGFSVSDSKFNGELITTFRSKTSGEYLITVTNGEAESVNIDSVYAKVPFTGGNVLPEVRALGGVLIGTGVMVGGVIVLIIGGIILASGRGKEEIDAGDSGELFIAKWSDRFFAWLIDFAIIMILMETILHAFSLSFWSGGDPASWFSRIGSMDYLIRSLIFFTYWTYLESTKSQSIGKMILHLKTVDIAGKSAGVRNIALATFGKCFILPVDLILGLLFTNEKRQRIFNRASNTIVIKVKQQEATSNISYTKE